LEDRGSGAIGLARFVPEHYHVNSFTK